MIEETSKVIKKGKKRPDSAHDVYLGNEKFLKKSETNESPLVEIMNLDSE